MYFKSVWNRIARTHGHATSTSQGGIPPLLITQKETESLDRKLTELLFSPYYLPAPELLKFITTIDTKTHKLHRKYTKSKAQLNTLNEISLNNNAYGRSAPERFIKGMIEMIVNDNTSVILAKKIGSKEVDIYIDKLGCVFEVQGFHWHYENPVKIRDDLKRARTLLESDLVRDIFFITPTKGKTLKKVSERFEMLVYTLPQIISNIQSVDNSDMFIRPMFKKKNNSSMAAQIAIERMCLNMYKYPEFTF